MPKIFTGEVFRFGVDWVYHQQKQSTILEKEENTKMKMKIYKLEKIVHEMTENIIQLESKVKDIECRESLVKKVTDSAKIGEEPKKVFKPKNSHDPTKI